MDFEDKVMYFLCALTDLYKDEDERECFNLTKLEIEEESLTEDFTAILYAVYILYKRITGDDTDVIGFTHICNRLAFQQIEKDRAKSD